MTYSDLVNKNGTIYNTKTGKGYSSPAELATDLGIRPDQINWGSIASAPAQTTQPTQQTSQTTQTAPTTQSTQSSAPTPQAGGTYWGIGEATDGGNSFKLGPFNTAAEAQTAANQYASGKSFNNVRAYNGDPGTKYKTTDYIQQNPTPSTQQPRSLVDIANSRPDVLNTARSLGGDPFTSGTAANTWLNDWWNTEGQKEYPGVTLGQGNSSNTQQLTPDEQSMSSTLDAVQQMLDKLVQKGQTINPNVDITPEKAAEFLAQAQNEINPYYTSQIQLARSSLLQGLGYSAQQVQDQETQWERQYGLNVQQIGTSEAEKGMAQSGERQLQEQNLASDTQYQVNQARNLAQYNATNQVQSYAQQWGGSNLPNTSISATPTVLAGQTTFEKSGNSTPFYQLSDNVYQGLTGSQQYQQQADISSRQSQLEGAWRTTQANQQQRTLNL